MVVSQDGEIMTDDDENPPGTSAQPTPCRISTRIAKRKDAEKDKKILDKSKLHADDARNEALLNRKGFANGRSEANESAGKRMSTESTRDIDQTPSGSHNPNQIFSNDETTGDPDMEDICRAVEDIFIDYVSRHVAKAKILEHKKYMRILTTMCNKARKPMNKDADGGTNEQSEDVKASGRKEKIVKPSGESNEGPKCDTKSNAADLKALDNTKTDVDNISNNNLNLHNQADGNDAGHTFLPQSTPSNPSNNVVTNCNSYYNGSRASDWGNNQGPYYGNYNSWWNHQYPSNYFPLPDDHSKNLSERNNNFPNYYTSAPQAPGHTNFDENMVA